MSKNEKEWVSARAVAWVIHDAPVPADLAFTLTVIASRCDEHGRGSYASVPTIAEKTGKSPDQVRRDIKRLLDLELLLLGDQSRANHLPGGQRPVVYDVPLNLRGPKPIKESRNRTGGKKPSAPGMDATPRIHATPGMDAPQTPCMDADRPLASMPPKKDLNRSLNNPSLSGLAKTISDATDATPDETREILDLITKENNPRSLAAYVKTLSKNGDLPALLTRIRTGDTTPPTTNGRYAPGTGALAPLPTDQDYATGKVIL